MGLCEGTSGPLAWEVVENAYGGSAADWNCGVIIDTGRTGGAVTLRFGTKWLTVGLRAGLELAGKVGLVHVFVFVQ